MKRYLQAYCCAVIEMIHHCLRSSVMLASSPLSSDAGLSGTPIQKVMARKCVT